MRSKRPDSPRDPLGHEEPGLDLETLQRRRERVLMALAFLIVLAAGGGTAWYLMHLKPTADAELVTAAQEAVTEALGPGLTLQFSSRTETQVVRTGPASYTVAARLTAVSAGGEAHGYAYSCGLVRLPDGRWGPAKLSITPR